jgi:hypothetical protein
MHGWMDQSVLALFDAYVKRDLKVILELGSWFGQSALEMCLRTDAQIITVDSYEFKKEWVAGIKNLDHSKLDNIREHFYANLWEHKDQVTPLHMRSVSGIWELVKYGVVPDLIYVDAGHDYENVNADLRHSFQAFPNAQIIGDDWQLGGVARAVLEFCTTNGKRVQLYDKKTYAIV